MKDWRDVITMLGGPAEFGRALGIPTEHAAQMKRRNSIPPRHWPRLMKVAGARGIELTPDSLSELAIKRDREREVAAA